MAAAPACASAAPIANSEPPRGEAVAATALTRRSRRPCCVVGPGARLGEVLADEPQHAPLAQRPAVDEASMARRRSRGRGRSGGRCRAPSKAAISSSLELEVEDVEVLADPLRRDRLGDDDVAELQVPAEDRLRRGLAVALRRSRRSPPRPAGAPCPSGLQASVAIPCSACQARSSAWWNRGCSSTWLTVGTVSVSRSSRSRSSMRKLETPIERARPSSLDLFEGPPGLDEEVLRSAPASGSGRGRRSPCSRRPSDFPNASRVESWPCWEFQSLVVTKTSSRGIPEAAIAAPTPRSLR